MTPAGTIQLPERGDPPLGLPKSLFWDVDPAKIDLDKNAPFVIGPVVEFGGLAAWHAIRRPLWR